MRLGLVVVWLAHRCESPRVRRCSAAEDADILKHAVAGTTEETQATLLLKRRKDMRMVDEALEAVKQQFKLRMERLAERQALFEEVRVLLSGAVHRDRLHLPAARALRPPPQKQKALQDMVAKFKPFIEEVRAR